MQFSWVKVSYLTLATLIVINLAIFFSQTIIGQRLQNQEQCRADGFELISEYLPCDETYSLSKGSLTALKNEIDEYIDNQVKQGVLVKVSVYVRDLYNGPTLNINGAETFAPASLLKLPLLITYLNLAQSQPEILNDKMVYVQPEVELFQIIPPTDPIVPGMPYTVNELLVHMMSQSDNRAYYALLDYLNQISPEVDLLQQTYLELGIVDPDNLSDQTISTKGYISIFHQLFYSSYYQQLSTSEQALEYLTHSEYVDGLVAGVPANIIVAHKFGERVIEESAIVQLHDCGIVYFPGNPYSICVMTQGHDLRQLEDVIAEISKKVYAEFNSRQR